MSSRRLNDSDILDILSGEAGSEIDDSDEDPAYEPDNVSSDSSDEETQDDDSPASQLSARASDRWCKCKATGSNLQPQRLLDFLNEMDLEVEIKQEIVWLEETASISLDSYANNTAGNDSTVEVESQASIIPKVENDGLDLRTEDDITVLSVEVKEEIFEEQPTVDQLVPCSQEENNLEIVGNFTKRLMLSCDAYDETLNQNFYANRHSLTDTRERPYHGSACESAIPHKSQFQRQLIPCSVCGIKFVSKKGLKIHLRTHSEENRYRCTLCNGAFFRKADLKSHLQKHTEGHFYQCSVCCSRFFRIQNFEKHLRTHYKERPFYCTVCDEKFAEQASMEAHLLSHSAERLYDPLSNKKFHRKVNKKPHQNISGQRLYICSVCSKNFIRKQDFQRHLLIHSGERPFACVICHKTFNRKHHLKNHKVTHCRETSFCCSICNKTFTSRQRLRTHVGSHSRAKLYRCTICNSKFVRKGNFKKHLLTHSGERNHVSPNIEDM